MYALMLVSAAVTAIFLQPVVADIKRLSEVRWTMFEGQDTTRPIVAEVAGRFEQQIIFALIYFRSMPDDICYEYEKPGLKELFCDYPAKVYLTNNASQPKEGHYTENCFNESNPSALNPIHRDIKVSYDGGSQLIFPNIPHWRISHSDFAELDQFLNGVVPTRDIMIMVRRIWTMYKGGKKRPVVVELYGYDDIHFQDRYCYITLESKLDNEVQEEDIGGEKICKYPAKVYLDDRRSPPKDGYFPGNCTIRDDPTSWYPQGQTLYVVYDNGTKAMRFHNIKHLRQTDFATLDQFMNGVVPTRDIMIMPVQRGWRMYKGNNTMRPIVAELYGRDNIHFQKRYCYIYLENKPDNVVQEEDIGGKTICKYPAKVYLDEKGSPPRHGYFPGNCTIRDDPTSWYPQGQTLYVVYDNDTKAMRFQSISHLRRMDFAELDQVTNGVLPIRDIMIMSSGSWRMYKGENTTRPIVVQLYGHDDIPRYRHLPIYRYCYIYLENKLDKIQEEDIGGKKICKYPAKVYPDKSGSPPKEGYFPGNCTIKDDPTSWYPQGQTLHVVYDNDTKAMRFNNINILQQIDLATLDQFTNGVVPTHDIMMITRRTWRMYKGKNTTRPIVVELFGYDQIRHKLGILIHCFITVENKLDNEIQEEYIGGKKICKYPAKVYVDEIGKKSPPKKGYFPGNCTIKDDAKSWYPQGETLYVVYDDGKKALRFHDIYHLQLVSNFVDLDRWLDDLNGK